APLVQDGAQRGQVGVVIGIAADQDVVAAAAPECVGPGAADQQIATATAGEGIGTGPSDQDVVGGAAAGIQGVVAVAAEEEGRYRQAAGQLEGVVAPVAVHEEMGEGNSARGGESSDRSAVDAEGDAVAGARAERESLGVRG